MSAEFKLSYTATEINSKLGMIGQHSKDISDIKQSMVTVQSTASNAVTTAQNAQTTADSANQKADTLKEVIKSFHSNIVESASGEVIQLSDASDLELAGLRIFGKTEQRTTTGKNILPNRYAGGYQHGIQYDANPDGSYHVYGNATANSQHYFSTSGPIAYDFTKTMVLSGGLPNVRVMMWLYDASGKYIAAVNNENKVQVFNRPDAVNATCILEVPAGATVDVIVYPQLELGSTATTYEPYTGGIPSPNPEYPQSLESVGDSVNVTVCGKNLLSTKVEDYTGMTAEVFDGRNCLSWLDDGTNFTYERDFPENTPLTFTLTLYNTGPTPALFYIYYTDGSKLEIVFWPGWSTHKAITDSNKTVSRLCGSWFDGKRLRLDLDSSQIEIGTNATTYEPYKDGGSVTVTPKDSSGNSLHLPGIPVTSGGNYTDPVTKQQWLCDEVDFAKGVYVQRIGKFVANGTETWSREGNKFYTDLHDAKRCLADGNTHLLSPGFKDIGSSYSEFTPGSMSTYSGNLTTYPGQNWLYVMVSENHSTASDVQSYFFS